MTKCGRHPIRWSRRRMALLRVLHAADLPDPGKLAKDARGACRARACRACRRGADANGIAAPVGFARLVGTGRESLGRAASFRPRASCACRSGPICGRARQAASTRATRNTPTHRAGSARRAVSPSPASAGSSRRATLARRSPRLRRRRAPKREEARAAMREHPLVKAMEAAFPDAELIEDGAAQPPARREVPWNRRA